MSRPPSLTLIGWLFIATGCGVLVHSARSATDPRMRLLGEVLPMAGSGLLALVGGAFALRGRDWARWCLVAWMGGHVLLGLGHSLPKLLVHLGLFAPITIALFRPSASSFFERTKQRP